ncbi:MAG: hypothetical protein AAF694_00025 [Bacteroidota bacterium]
MVTPIGKRTKVLPLPVFITTKIDAFFDQGIKDVYASSDLEDLVYLITPTSGVVAQISSAPLEVKKYLTESTLRMLKDFTIRSGFYGYLSYENVDDQFEMLLVKLK